MARLPESECLLKLILVIILMASYPTLYLIGYNNGENSVSQTSHSAPLMSSLDLLVSSYVIRDEACAEISGSSYIAILGEHNVLFHIIPSESSAPPQITTNAEALKSFCDAAKIAIDPIVPSAIISPEQKEEDMVLIPNSCRDVRDPSVGLGATQAYIDFRNGKGMIFIAHNIKCAEIAHYWHPDW